MVHSVRSVRSVHPASQVGVGQGTMIAYECKSLNGMKSIVKDYVGIGPTKAE